jgi:hypothetical protein
MTNFDIETQESKLETINGIQLPVFTVPQFTYLYRGSCDDESHGLINTQNGYFGFQTQDILTYGFPRKYTTTRQLNLVDTKKIYQDGIFITEEFNNLLQNIYKNNNGNIERNSVKTEDDKVFHLLRDLGMDGYAAKSITDKGFGYLNAECFISDPVTTLHNTIGEPVLPDTDGIFKNNNNEPIILLGQQATSQTIQNICNEFTLGKNQSKKKKVFNYHDDNSYDSDDENINPNIGRKLFGGRRTHKYYYKTNKRLKKKTKRKFNKKTKRVIKKKTKRKFKKKTKRKLKK